MNVRKVAVTAGILSILLAACSSGTATPAPATAAPATAAPATAAPATEAPSVEAPSAEAGCTVGVSWNNYQEERWAKWDEPALKAAIETGGGKYISNDAKSSAETQASNVENLISQGANVVIVLAQDGTAIKPAVAAAIADGVPVIAYDRLIEDPAALYITFDNVEVGRMQARAVLEAMPKGNYVFIKGNQADANADFLRGGQQEILQAAIDSGDIKNVGESYTDNWDPAVAQTNMEQILSANDNKVDAVVASNDGTAGGVVEALRAQGLAGKVPVSGQDGDQAALNRVAKGEQTVSVWKDARELGTAAGTAAIALCANPDIKSVAGVVQFASPGGNDMTSIFLTPIPIKKDNLSVVVDAGWIAKEALCQGVTDTATVPACQ
jgi:D-xylose transport system substrate-binding protein